MSLSLPSFAIDSVCRISPPAKVVSPWGRFDIVYPSSRKDYDKSLKFKLYELGMFENGDKTIWARIRDNKGRDYMVGGDNFSKPYDRTFVEGLRGSKKCRPARNQQMVKMYKKFDEEFKKDIASIDKKLLEKTKPDKDKKKKIDHHKICVATSGQSEKVQLKQGMLRKYSLKPECELNLYGQLMKVDEKTPKHYHNIYYREDVPAMKKPEAGYFVVEDCHGDLIIIEPDDMAQASAAKFQQRGFACGPYNDKNSPFGDPNIQRELADPPPDDNPEIAI